MKRGNTERQARWVQVEALCLCAALEREFGRIDTETIRSFDYPASVIDEAIRLADRRRKLSVWRRIDRRGRAALGLPV